MEDNYTDRIAWAANLGPDQLLRLEEAMKDLARLMVKAAASPEDEDTLQEMGFCKLTIESLGVVSYNQVKEEAMEIANELFMKGLSMALSSL